MSNDVSHFFQILFENTCLILLQLQPYTAYVPANEHFSMLSKHRTHAAVTPKKRATHWHLGPFGWAVSTALIGWTSCMAGFALSPWRALAPDLETQAIHSSLFALALTVFGEVFNLHLPAPQTNRLAMTLKSLASSALATALWILFLYFTSYQLIGRYIVIQAFGYSALLLAGLRLYAAFRNRSSRIRLMVVGHLSFIQWIEERIARQKLPFEISATLDASSQDALIHRQDGAMGETGESMEPLSRFDEICHELQIDEMVIEKHQALSDALAAELIESLFYGVRISSAESFVERVWQMIPIDQIDAGWLHALDLKLTHPFYRRAKRLMDVALSSIGLILAAPLIAICALIIKLQDGGPVFYIQTRAGRFGQPFNMFKLRTMRIDAEQSGPQWAEKGDRRATWFGRLLRATRMDELPQLLNILSGEMSLVGPRPERPEFVEKLTHAIPLYRFRHLLQPGLTGWAQVNYRYGASIEDTKMKLCYDFYYIKNLSLLMDVQILLKTIGSVARGSR